MEFSELKRASYDSSTTSSTITDNSTGTTNSSNHTIDVTRHDTNVAYGPLALNSAPCNSECVGIGFAALQHCVIHEDTALGYYAARNITTAQACTAFGYCALTSATEKGQSDDNTAIGHRAANNTNASGNTAVGSGSLLFNESGKENTAYGAHTSPLNIIGNYNTTIGYHAGYGILEGDDNTIIGHFSQRAVAPVSRVTSLGAKTLTYNSAFDMVAIGYSALHNNQTGQGNVAIGAFCLESTVTGNNCTGVGDRALQKAWGSDNTIVGAKGMCMTGSTGSENTGTGAHVLSNCVASRNTANGFKSLFANTTGYHNVADGYMSLCRVVGGANNTAIGTGSGSGIVDGKSNVCVGFQAGPLNDLEDTICIGAGARATQSGDLVLGSAQHPLITGKMVGTDGDANPLPVPQLYLTVIINGERYLIPLFKATASSN